MRCLIRSHHQDYKLPLPNEEGEAGGSLEPDPRYGRCCSAVCRPGYALRDALLGLLVLLGLAVVVTVIFVVCFYVLPDEKHLIEEGLLSSTAEGIIREPVEVNEIKLRDGDAYNVAPNDPQKSTVGRSQDFNTFSTTANFEHTTTQLSSADASQFTVFQDSSDVVSPSRDPGRTPGLQGRENFENDNFHKHRDGQNERRDRHNLGHNGERPVLEGEDDQFQGEGSRKEEEIDFVADLSPQPACSSVQLPMCTTTVPWSSTGKPNFLGHTVDQDIFASLATVRRLLVESQCSALAPLYACSILEPPCRDSVVLPPCRNFCLDVARSCQVPATSGIADMFDCERFPDSTDPNVCVSAQQELLHLTNTATTGPDILPEHFHPHQNQPGSQLDQEVTQHQPPLDSSPDPVADDTSLPLPPDVEMADVQDEEDGLAICTMDMFMCLDGSDCLSHDYVCDGHQNCVDYSDEANCTNGSPECSGEDDFQCATTGLCVPSSWLCDGADDCRDNSDEQNCPLRRAGFGPVTNDGTIGHPPSPEDGPSREQFGPRDSESDEPLNSSGPIGDAEVPGGIDNVPANFRETAKPGHVGQAEGFSNQHGDELRSPNRDGLLQSDVPPFAYDEYDSSGPLVYNDPALVGPSLGDPNLLEASLHPDFSVNNEKPKVLRNHPEVHDDEAKLHASGDADSESGDDLVHPVLQGRPTHQNTGSNEVPETLYDVSGDRSESINQHPIPDVDYPAKETFSVDSSSSVDQDFHRFADKKSEEYIPLNEENRSSDSNVDSPGELILSDEEAIPSSKAPSQRIRERLAGAQRRRLHPSQVPSRQIPPTVNEDELPIEDGPVNVRSTRPPSRLESFQERFRQWKEKRQPTLPAEYQNLRPTRIPQTRRAPLAERNYELVRRRPQRVTSRRPTDVEPEEVSVPEPQSDLAQAQSSQEHDYKPPAIGQPITLPKNVLPEPEIDTDDDAGLAESPHGNRFNRLRANRRRLQNRNRISSRRNRYQDARVPNEGPPPETPQQEQDATRNEDEFPQERREIVPPTDVDHQPPVANEHINKEIATDAIGEDRFSANFGDHNLESDRTNFDQDDHEGYDQRNPGNFHPDSRNNFEGNNREDFEQNNRELYDHNDRGKYDQDVGENYDESYDENNRGDYDQNIPRDYDQNLAPEYYEPPSYRPQAQYGGPPKSQDYPRPESESQFDPPNDFRVSFPLPRNIGPSRPALYGHHEQGAQLQDPIQVAESSKNSYQYIGHQPKQRGRHQVAQPPRPAPTHRRSFQYREDALASDLSYNVPAVNQRPFRIYSPSSEGHLDPYSSVNPRPL